MQGVGVGLREMGGTCVWGCKCSRPRLTPSGRGGASARTPGKPGCRNAKVR